MKLPPLQNIAGSLQRTLGCLLRPLPHATLRMLFSAETLYASVSQRRKVLFHVAPPKSGSTWVSAILQSLTGWNASPMWRRAERREQEIDLLQLHARHHRRDLLCAQQHIRYTSSMQEFLDHTQGRVLLQSRNLFDTTLSIRDHFHAISCVGPSAYMDQDNWSELSPEQQLDFVVDMVLPWYFNFYASWLTSPLWGSEKLHVIQYEAMCDDATREIRSLADWVGLAASAESVQSALALAAKAPTRKNVATTGRGDLLDEDQKQRIRRYASYYPKINFAQLGLLD